MHLFARRLDFVKQLRPELFDNAAQDGRPIHDFVSDNEKTNLLQLIVIHRLVHKRRHIHLRTFTLPDLASPRRVAGCPCCGALTPKQREQDDDGKGNTQQPQQCASTEAHVSLHDLHHRANALYWNGFLVRSKRIVASAD
jgi:hypothetical protein